ncbi:hypothetical protein ZHAS_00018952 [Anopheles sinensis]|uniref:Uncharacterized protein n=1 Tax=Anopheles sinensis TaxID=74873 RepID=A0A084WK84_ANOSI|nr:hypothetical protein ZHAS_00018952 [Anopheles sinensis]
MEWSERERDRLTAEQHNTTRTLPTGRLHQTPCTPLPSPIGSTAADADGFDTDADVGGREEGIGARLWLKSTPHSGRSQATFIDSYASMAHRNSPGIWQRSKR